MLREVLISALWIALAVAASAIILIDARRDRLAQKN